MCLCLAASSTCTPYIMSCFIGDAAYYLKQHQRHTPQHNVQCYSRAQTFVQHLQSMPQPTATHKHTHTTQYMIPITRSSQQPIPVHR